MNPKIHPRLEIPGALAEALFEAARLTAVAVSQLPARTRPRRGLTLKPGTATPLWNELARALRAQLTRHGDKARLARLLGHPRQRVHELLVSPQHLPDAERTLMLLVWLGARNSGYDLPAAGPARMSRNT